jgi:hypothetical protein
MALALKSVGKRGEQEIESEFGRMAKKIIGEGGLQGSLGNDTERNALKIPEGAQGGARHYVPNAPLARIRGPVENVIVANDSVDLARSICASPWGGNFLHASGRLRSSRLAT